MPKATPPTHNARAFNVAPLAELAARERLSGRALAARCGVDPATVRAWFAGATSPTSETLARVAARTGLDPRRLLNV